MTHPHLTRRSVLGIGAGGALSFALALSAVAPWQSRDAEAQVNPALSETGGEPDANDPTLPGPGVGVADTDPALSGSGSALEAPATPVAPEESLVPPPTWEPTDAGMSTSLGGSDIAVASEGGSYQVDAPRRKTNKIKGDSKRP